MVRPSKKRPKMDAKTHSQKTSESNFQKIGFGIHFGLPKPFKIASKSRKIAPKSDAERSSFRDAMEIARTSAEINGTHRLQSVQMAIHMIRST